MVHWCVLMLVLVPVRVLMLKGMLPAYLITRKVGHAT